MASKVRREAVRAGLVAVAGVFSGTRGCLAFFASRLAPTGVWGASSGLMVVGLALSPAGWLPQGVCVVAGIWGWPRGFRGFFVFGSE